MRVGLGAVCRFVCAVALLALAGCDDTAPALTASEADRAAAAAALATGGDHSCAILTDGGVRCWGQDSVGELGYDGSQIIGDDEHPEWAGPVDLGGVAVVAVTAGYEHTCVLTDAGDVHCWGDDRHGQLGNGPGVDADASPTVPVDLGGKAQAIAAGDFHTCAVLTDGAVRCWGDNKLGALGYASPRRGFSRDKTPAELGDIDLGGTATGIAAGRDHTCALLDDGAVRCWGRAHLGQLGYGNEERIGDDETPAAAGDVPLGGTAVAITARHVHTCALLDDGAVRCWGSPRQGRLGYGTTEPFTTPADAGDVPLGADAIAVSAGGYHTCAILETGRLRCWGENWAGQLGTGEPETLGDDETPEDIRDIPLGGEVLAVSAGWLHTCAALVNGEVRCWGYAAHGALGLGEIDGNVGDDETPDALPPVRLGGDLLGTPEPAY